VFIVQIKVLNLIYFIFIIHNLFDFFSFQRILFFILKILFDSLSIFNLLFMPNYERHSFFMKTLSRLIWKRSYNKLISDPNVILLNCLNQYRLSFDIVSLHLIKFFSNSQLIVEWSFRSRF
jgi:hypothetical protein